MKKHRTFVSCLLALLSLPAIGLALEIGDSLPSAGTKMKNVDNRELTLKEIKGEKGTLVVFSCNACPYSQAWESRIIDLAKTAQAKNIGVAMVNSNDPKVVAEDSFEMMQKRAKEKDYSFPYLFDATSNVAREYGAARTPEVFLFDANDKLTYHGAVDDNAHEPKKVQKRYLLEALNAIETGKPIPENVTKAIGCTIKFRS